MKSALPLLPVVASMPTMIASLVAADAPPEEMMVDARPDSSGAARSAGLLTCPHRALAAAAASEAAHGSVAAESSNVNGMWRKFKTAHRNSKGARRRTNHLHVLLTEYSAARLCHVAQEGDPLLTGRCPGGGG